MRWSREVRCKTKPQQTRQLSPTTATTTPGKQRRLKKNKLTNLKLTTNPKKRNPMMWSRGVRNENKEHGKRGNFNGRRGRGRGGKNNFRGGRGVQNYYDNRTYNFY
ncbi:uncharacterized protein LOC116159065 [Photinus pyralis]|uniref:uncharacterized protein LOC116159065 n=1 Tax=Photinus pyralis TaxID=7054 RepID=UPI0012673C42|nr:uncharacterized protein LOC116159065 [Photinus pyralis]